MTMTRNWRRGSVPRLLARCSARVANLAGGGILLAAASPVYAFPAPVPEPGTLGLIAAGAGAAWLVARRRRK